MAQNEKITPVTEDEIDDIRVTLELEDGDIECKIITIFTVNAKDYIALLPLDENGVENTEGEVYIYGYSEDEQGLPSLRYIEDEEEYDAAADRFDELLDEVYFEESEE